MASEGKHISIVALNGTNYPTWKVQCRMALIREGLWGIVSEGPSMCKYPLYYIIVTSWLLHHSSIVHEVL